MGNISQELPIAAILLRLLSVVALFFDVLEQGKLRLEESGLTIPFPQRDVHLSHVETQVN